MKKITFISIIFILSAFLLVSCGGIKEYDGEPINEIIYYTGGEMYDVGREYRIDFTDNRVFKKEMREGSEYIEIKQFSEEDEKSFFNSCYTYGLFDIDEQYYEEVLDGTNWSLTLKYANGEIKKSQGYGDSPSTVFDKCSVVFYDLCGERVLGNFPEYFRYPPSFNYSTNVEVGLKCADYRWSDGRFVSDNNDYFAINETNFPVINQEDKTYKLILSTGKTTPRFSDFIMKCYDYNEELTGEKVVKKLGYFDTAEFSLELNKIYVFETRYENGDYVRYTFNTRVKSEVNIID